MVILLYLHVVHYRRMTQLYEFEEVRRVSALVLSYLPPPVWSLRTIQVIQDSLHNKDHYTAKICIFSWFNGIAAISLVFYYLFPCSLSLFTNLCQLFQYRVRSYRIMLNC